MAYPNERINNRKNKLKKIWLSKEWKEKRLEKIKQAGGKCQQCGSEEYLTIHHPFGHMYKMDKYLDLGGCIVLCRRCHTALHKNMNLCPLCKTRYKPVLAYSCSKCDPDYKPKKQKRSKRKNRHKKYEED